MMALGDRERRKRYLVSLGFGAVGVLLGAVQILPTWELLRNSVRASASYDFFASFSMPKASVMTFLAPFLMGGGDGRLFCAPYIGQSFYTEYVPYASVLAIMLALVALGRRDRRTKFWAGVVVVALMLAFGANAPLSLNRIVYFVPVLTCFAFSSSFDGGSLRGCCACRSWPHGFIDYRQESKEALHRVHRYRVFCVDLFGCDLGTTC
jgi:hypothetical protein